MKTTNFFIDYLVIGVILILGILFPAYLFDLDFFKLFENFSTKDKAHVLPFMMVIIYISGILFNQVSDVFLSKANNLLGLAKIEKEEKTLNDLVEGGYHAALQKVVLASQSAYDFLSFRRSIIRIFRSTFVALIISLIISVVLEINNIVQSSPSGLSLYGVAVIYVIIGSFIRYRLIKLQVGYYKAISNFYMSCNELEESKARIISNIND